MMTMRQKFFTFLASTMLITSACVKTAPEPATATPTTPTTPSNPSKPATLDTTVYFKTMDVIAQGDSMPAGVEFRNASNSIIRRYKPDTSGKSTMSNYISFLPSDTLANSIVVTGGKRAYNLDANDRFYVFSPSGNTTTPDTMRLFRVATGVTGATVRFTDTVGGINVHRNYLSRLDQHKAVIN